ncbi:MAG: TM0996/MTH895 family glutaredoxin-like protein [Moorella sp. (in: Bacteria)]|nr:TM0996/MTH895 family glutaredoxin-like protein [Moorella sp. (in: firmicutes)]
MEIKVLGTGCARCKTLEQNVINALAELGVAADVARVTSLAEIMDYGVVMTPGLVINGKVKVAGQVPDKEEIKQWIAAEK